MRKARARCSKLSGQAGGIRPCRKCAALATWWGQPGLYSRAWLRRCPTRRRRQPAAAARSPRRAGRRSRGTPAPSRPARRRHCPQRPRRPRRRRPAARRAAPAVPPAARPAPRRARRRPPAPAGCEPAVSGPAPARPGLPPHAPQHIAAAHGLRAAHQKCSASATVRPKGASCAASMLLNRESLPVTVMA